MVADWSHRFPNGFGEAGGVEAIKGNIGAIPAFAGIVVFSPQRPESKGDARGSFWGRMVYPFGLGPFTCPPLPVIGAAKENSLVTRMR
jgi:hypothetical protein